MALQVHYFPFAFSPESITWPSLKTALSTDAKSGSSRIASATLNEGSGFHFLPLLTSDSAAAVIAYPIRPLPTSTNFRTRCTVYDLGFAFSPSSTSRRMGLFRPRRLN